MNIDCIAGRVVFAVTWRDGLDWSSRCDEQPAIRILLPGLGLNQPTPMCRHHGGSFLGMVMATEPTPKFAAVNFEGRPHEPGSDH